MINLVQLYKWLGYKMGKKYALFKVPFGDINVKKNSAGICEFALEMGAVRPKTDLQIASFRKHQKRKKERKQPRILNRRPTQRLKNGQTVGKLN